jgi:hypothetical protein
MAAEYRLDRPRPLALRAEMPDKDITDVFREGRRAAGGGSACVVGG